MYFENTISDSEIVLCFENTISDSEIVLYFENTISDKRAKRASRKNTTISDKYYFGIYL